jgi:hypothetical protein
LPGNEKVVSVFPQGIRIAEIAVGSTDKAARTITVRESRKGESMKQHSASLAGTALTGAVVGVLAAVLAATLGTASAHHSFAMFDAMHPREISGTVKEYRFVSPHTILIVTVKGEDGVDKDWILEGGAPGLLTRQGMTSKSLKPGDEITVTINPLHSGAEGGSYQPAQVRFKDGRPVAVPRE